MHGLSGILDAEFLAVTSGGTTAFGTTDCPRA